MMIKQATIFYPLKFEFLSLAMIVKNQEELTK